MFRQSICYLTKLKIDDRIIQNLFLEMLRVKEIFISKFLNKNKKVNVILILPAGGGAGV